MWVGFSEEKKKGVSYYLRVKLRNILLDDGGGCRFKSFALNTVVTDGPQRCCKYLRTAYGICHEPSIVALPSDVTCSDKRVSNTQFSI